MLKRMEWSQIVRAIVIIRGRPAYTQALFLALFRCGSVAVGENNSSRVFLLCSEPWSGEATTAVSSAGVASAVIAGPAKRLFCPAACTLLLLGGCPSLDGQQPQPGFNEYSNADLLFAQ